MTRKELIARRAAYVEEIKDLDEDIDLYESGTFTMQGKREGGPWVDRTAKMLENCKRMKANYERMIEEIDERIKNGDY